MFADTPILYSFALFSLALLLPILPAVIIHRIFPDTKVAAGGPLHGLNVKTSGAFAAYVITVLMGLVLTTSTMRLIESSHQASIHPASTILLELRPLDDSGNRLPDGVLRELQPVVRLDPEIYRIGERVVELDVPGDLSAYTILIDIPGFGQRRLIHSEIQLQKTAPGHFRSMEPIEVRQVSRANPG